MRTTEERLERVVCAEHCRLFKPWEERQKCAGFALLRDRVARGGLAVDAVERLRGARVRWSGNHDAVILRSACIRCELYPYRCPFRRPTKEAAGEPCGAALVLDALLERRVIRAQDLFWGEPTGEARPS